MRRVVVAILIWLGSSAISCQAFRAPHTGRRQQRRGVHHHDSTTTLALRTSLRLTTTTTTPSSYDVDQLPSSRTSQGQPSMPSWKSKLVKAGMLTYIGLMCLALPATLLPQQAAYKLGWMRREQKEHCAVRTACFCARWLLRLIPFCAIAIIPSGEPSDQKPVPSVWVCNHTSMLDVFLLLAVDKQLRGRNKRPIKVVYWEQLENNPISKLLFRQAGFISVNMEANDPGAPNEYHKSTFKKLLKECKQAFADGFDIGILPEGQLNPTPEQGLLPVFPGAYTLAKMSGRPIQMMALHGAHTLWHPKNGMTVTGRRTKLRCYPHGRTYRSAEEFKTTFTTVVGHFCATGQDLAPAAELEAWLTGAKWDELQLQAAAAAANTSKQEEESL